MKKLIIILISIIILAIGISFIRVNITQEQHNKQDQTSIQNQITQVTTIVYNETELKNVTWVLLEVENLSTLSNLESWQIIFCKVIPVPFEFDNVGTARMFLYYPVTEKSRPFTNISVVTNVGETSQTNKNEVEFNFFKWMFQKK